VTEYYPDDLFAVIERSENMTVDERDRLFAQLVYVVAHLHRHGLAHRDLKLENACVDSTGSLRLIDLGSSASARDRIGQVIKSHQIHGSDPYVAPEEPVADEHGYDPFAADCWSLGVIYLCLVRRCFHWEKADVDEDAGYRYFIN
ncbi:kinase-like domain-containing protein, partial [Syncephalis plumigaleata]